MGMNVSNVSGNSEPEALMDVNPTPLIDVMLVLLVLLLVMLIITIPMRLHTIPMDMPQSGPTSFVREPVVLIVSIDFDGTVYWDDEALAGQAAVDAKMRDVGAMALADQPEVHIKPNKLADYGAVAAVLASVQRNGVKKMGMVGNEQFPG